MKPRLKFTIDAAPNSEWRVRVIVWKTRKDFLKHAECKSFLAFCHRLSPKKAIKDKDSVFAELHFSEGEYLKLRYVIHETYHALISFAKLTKLRLVTADYDGEEWAACSMEYMVDGIVSWLKKNRIKIT